jgi:hypothetical protein
VNAEFPSPQCADESAACIRASKHDQQAAAARVRRAHRFDLADGPRPVRARAAARAERSRLWAKWHEVKPTLDIHAALRSSQTAVVILEPPADILSGNIAGYLSRPLRNRLILQKPHRVRREGREVSLQRRRAARARTEPGMHVGGMASFRRPNTSSSNAAARSRRRATASAMAPTPSATVIIVANHPKSPRAYSLTARLHGSTSGETTWSSPSTSRFTAAAAAATRAARRTESSQHITPTRCGRGGVSQADPLATRVLRGALSGRSQPSRHSETD